MLNRNSLFPDFFTTKCIGFSSALVVHRRGRGWRTPVAVGPAKVRGYPLPTRAGAGTTSWVPAPDLLRSARVEHRGRADCLLPAAARGGRDRRGSGGRRGDFHAVAF